MANDKNDIEANPFAKLKGLFPAKEEEHSFSSTIARRRKKQQPETSFLYKKKEIPVADEGDRTLFLSAMQSTVPAVDKSKQLFAGEESMSEVFASLGKNKSNTSNKKQKKTDKASRAESPLETLFESKDDALLFVDAMEGSVKKDYSAMAPVEELLKGNDEQVLFDKAMDGVAPVGGGGRSITKVPSMNVKISPSSKNIMQDILDGRIEFSLHNSDEYIEGHIVGIDPLVLGQLRNGEFSPEAHMDLHGQTADQAYGSLTDFIKNSYQRGLRTIIVITGRGKNSRTGVSVLRSLLHVWLTKDPFKRVTLAFCTARPHDGGAGAVYILLRKYKKNRGKIIWDIPYHGPEEV